MEQGMNLDPQVLISVQNERIAAAAMREAQLTAAVQQLTMEKIGLAENIDRLEGLITELKLLVPEVEEEDASADDIG